MILITYSVHLWLSGAYKCLMFILIHILLYVYTSRRRVVCECIYMYMHMQCIHVYDFPIDSMMCNAQKVKMKKEVSQHYDKGFCFVFEVCLVPFAGAICRCHRYSNSDSGHNYVCMYTLSACDPLPPASCIPTYIHMYTYCIQFV